VVRGPRIAEPTGWLVDKLVPGVLGGRKSTMMQQVLTIASHTLIQSIRQPIFLVLVMVGAFALIISPSLAAYTLSNDNKLLIDLGLSTLLVVGLLLAGFTASLVLGSELENKTILTILSKPVSRPVVIVGKYLGLAGALGVAMWILSLVFVLTVRHGVLQTVRDPLDGPVWVFGLLAGVVSLLIGVGGNYLYNRVFSSVFVVALGGCITMAWLCVMFVDKQWGFQPIGSEFGDQGALQGGQLVIGLVLVFEAVLVLGAVALAASTRLSEVMTLLVCVGVFLLGLVSDYMLGRLADEYLIGTLLYLSAPNLQVLWIADALTEGHRLNGEYMLLATGYAGLYIMAVLGLGVALFEGRELG